MARSLTSLIDFVCTPYGTSVPESGTTVYLSDAEFALVTPSSIGVAWTDNGQVDSVGDEVSVQADNVAAVGALTATTTGSPIAANPAALTAVAPAAMGQAAITGGEDPTETEFNTLRTDVVNVRAEVVKLVTDLTATRAEVVKLVTDVTEVFTKFDAGVADLATLKTKINSILTEITGAGKPMSA